jgi:hypothetical protein
MKYFILIIYLSFNFNLFALTHSLPEENTFFNSVIFTKSDAPDSKGDTTPAYCNATLLAENIALTAAHCIQLAYVSGDRKIQIEKGAYKYFKTKEGEIRKIGYVPNATISIQSEIEISPSLKDKFDRLGFKAKISPSEDVALIWWHENSEVLKQDAYPTIATLDEFKQITKNINNYKFLLTTINPFSEISLDTKRSAILDNLKWTFTNYVESRSSSRVEEGDSGSPLFVSINNQNKIFAVVKGKASTVLSNWDAFSSVSQIVCEIEKKLPDDLKINSCLK